MNHEAFAGFRTNAWENPWAGSSSVCVNADWNKYRSCFHRLKVIVKICYLKLAKDVDEDPPIEHGLTVHRRDQVGDFLSSFEMQGKFVAIFCCKVYIFGLKVSLHWTFFYACKKVLPEKWANPTSPWFSRFPASEIIIHLAPEYNMADGIKSWDLIYEPGARKHWSMFGQSWRLNLPFTKLWLLKVIPTCICCPSKESKDCSALYRACSWGRVAGLSNIWWN